MILLGQSHGGAKFAGMVRDHWRWDNDLKIVLFVSWDSADLGGGVSSVGDRPETVLAFFQRGDLAHWQNGKHIEQATEEHDLTDHLSHNAIARSEFVHDKTATFIRDAISSIRGRSRGGSAATFRMDADGSLGEEIEVRRLHPTFSVARAFRLGAADCMCLLGTSDGHVQIRRLTDHGLLGGVVRDSAVSSGFTAGAIYTVGDATFILLVNDANEEAIVREIRPDGSLGAQRYPSSPQQRVTGPLKGPWDHADAFRIGNEQFLCVCENERRDSRRARGRGRTAHDDRADSPSGSFLPNPTPSSILSMTVFALGANVYLFTTGDGLSTFRINADGSIGARVFHESTPLGQLAFSTTAHLGVGGDHSMLLLDAVGRMQVRRVNANGSLGQTLSARQTGRTGRNSLATFVKRRPRPCIPAAASVVNLLERTRSDPVPGMCQTPWRLGWRLRARAARTVWDHHAKSGTQLGDDPLDCRKPGCPALARPRSEIGVSDDHLSARRKRHDELHFPVVAESHFAAVSFRDPRDTLGDIVRRQSHGR